MNNFTVSDLVGSVCAIILFVPLTIAPGYVFAWFTNAFAYRTLSAQWRFLIAIPLSIALTPILTYWLGSAFGWPAVWLFHGILAIICLALLAGFFGHERVTVWATNLKQTPRAAWIIAGVWLVISVFSLVDLQLGDRLYFSVTAYDHSVRTAITDAIDRTGVRPENPFYHLGAAFPLRYHYFWFIACSLVDRMGGSVVDARRAIIGSVVWSGWAFACIVPLFLRFVSGFANCMLRRVSIVALALTIVTGLDIIPTIYDFLTTRVLLSEMEWWNNQITSWWGTGLWVPHHLAALTIGLTGLVLLWRAATATSRNAFSTEAILAGICFATMVGTSVYVALIFAAFLVAWIVVSWILRERRHAVAVLVAGAVTLIFTLPYLATLFHASHGAGGNGGTSSFVKPTIRDFAPLDAFLETRHVPFLAQAALRLIALPVNYFLELGFFAVVAIAYLFSAWRRKRWDLRIAFTVLLAATSVFICTFLRSGVIANNDLGDRGFLAAQFVFLLWAAELIVSRQAMTAARPSRLSPWLRSPLWAPLILLGALGTIYELGLLRFNAPLADAHVYPLDLSPDHNLGLRTFAMRSAYDRLHEMTAVSAIVQNNPQWKYADYFYGLYAHRQTAAYDPSCGATFGGSMTECKMLYPEIVNIFSNEKKVTPAQVAELAKKLNIDAVLVKDLDPSWQDRQTWVWQLQPAIANRFVRVFLFPSRNTL
jgi:hypothetical protein